MIQVARVSGVRGKRRSLARASGSDVRIRTAANGCVTLSVPPPEGSAERKAGVVYLVHLAGGDRRRVMEELSHGCE